MNLQAVVLVVALSLTAAANAREGQRLPWHLLGSNFPDIKPDLLAVVYDRDYRDDYDNGRVDHRLLVMDQGRRYVRLHTSDRVITEIYVSDELYVTDKGIRIGDTLSTVRRAYPEAFRLVVGKDLYLARFQVSEGAGQITFWFDNSDIKRRWHRGELVLIEDESVGRAELRGMHMVAK